MQPSHPEQAACALVIDQVMRHFPLIIIWGCWAGKVGEAWGRRSVDTHCSVERCFALTLEVPFS